MGFFKKVFGLATDELKKALKKVKKKCLKDNWSYEQEVRYVKIVQTTNEGKPYKADLPIRIKKIYLGIRASNKDSIERIVKAIDSNIIVEKLKRSDIKFWKYQLERSRKSFKE